MAKSIFIIISFTLLSFITKAQTEVTGKTEYPDSMILQKEYKFKFFNDTMQQSITIKAIGEEKIQFDIEVVTKDDLILGGKSRDTYSGVAQLKFFGIAEKEDGKRYISIWDYRSLDNLLSISIYGQNLTSVSVETTKLNSSKMNRAQ